MAVLEFVVALAQRDDLRHFNEVLGSWPAQLTLIALYLGLAILAFTRVARDFDDPGGVRWFRAAAVGLGVFIILAVLLRDWALRDVVWPVWPQLIAYLWLCALWIYYLLRTLTRIRPGRPDAEARERGAALKAVLDEAEVERRREGGAPASTDRPS
jgi:Ca2+/Na+ antiporter